MKSASLLLGQYSLKCLDQRFSDALILDKTKVVVGSLPQCDVVLNDASISSYHAFFYINSNEGVLVKDLCSEKGIFVNGTKVSECFVAPGDVIMLGNVAFELLSVEDQVPLFNPDEHLTPVSGDEIPTLPPREGLTFIDGDYCDIQFDETGFNPIDQSPLSMFQKGDYEQTDDMEGSIDTSEKSSDWRVEVVTYVNGLIVDIRYLPWKSGDYYLTSESEKKNFLPFYGLKTEVRFFSIQGDKLEFNRLPELVASTGMDPFKETVFFTAGVHQVSVHVQKESVKFKTLPLWIREKDFYKQATKVFAGIFVPFLLLLFVTLPSNEPVEEVAVIYKIAPEKIVQKEVVESDKNQEVAAKEISSTKENTGHKENTQDPQKVEFAQASQKQKTVAKAEAPKTAKPVAATKPSKAYEFNTDVTIDTAVGDAPQINTEAIARTQGASGEKFNVGTEASGDLVAGGDVGVSKFNGSDKSGSGSASYGSRGLASKKGFDTSYLETKTVVLGSMDPELLRKILREYIPQFRHCYQQELIKNSEKIKGVIDLNFSITANGRVGKMNIRAKDARFSRNGIDCMGQVLGIIEFPKPKGGGIVDVRQPLNFFAETEKI
ncbi:MAG: FHA domain-containing protein [Bacteriovoracaceae bacterium]